MDIYDLRKELSMGKSIYDINLKVTFYARVSTGSDEQAHSLNNQVSYYKEFIKGRPNWTYVDGYIDEALSGTSVTKRESFLKMIDDAKLNKFELIITKEISRFSRSTLDSIMYTQELLKSSVGVIFQTDNINTLMPDAELRLTIMSSIAQDEVRKISERVKFGFKRAIENGVVLGNSKIWGYTKQNGKLVIVPEEAEIVRQIYELYAVEKLGVRAICKVFENAGIKTAKDKNFSFTTVKNIIKNPKYKGYYCGKKSQKYDYRSNDRKVFDDSEWVMYKDEDKVPPIVCEELWNKANKILSKRSENSKSCKQTSYDNKYKYSCKIVCGEHKVFYHRTLFRYKSGNKEAWQCKLYYEKGKAGCSLPVLYTTELDEVMKDAYNSLKIEKSAIINDLVKIYSTIGSESTNKVEKEKLQLDIKNIEIKKDKLLDLSIKGALSDNEFKKRNNSFNEEIKKSKLKINKLEYDEEKNKELASTIKVLSDSIANELEFKDGFDNSIIDTILDRIEVYGTGNRKNVSLKVYFKIFEESIHYEINRRNKTSVCFAQYI